MRGEVGGGVGGAGCWRGVGGVEREWNVGEGGGGDRIERWGGRRLGGEKEGDGREWGRGGGGRGRGGRGRWEGGWKGWVGEGVGD